MGTFLPMDISPERPPIKMQGMKVNLVPFIARSIEWDGIGVWVEPFLGSGAVAFNVNPSRAILADTNRHLINFYREMQSGYVNGASVRFFLEKEGGYLFAKGERHYYDVRERFNYIGSPFDFLFLNHSCFNGVMRFNKKGGFNVPFCRNTKRFSPSLINRIVNQVEWASQVIKAKKWVFIVQDWRDTVAMAGPGDMVYCDPPYVGRNTTYYNTFEDSESDELAKKLLASDSGFAFSTWLESKGERNEFVDRWFLGLPKYTRSHFYRVGSYARYRHNVVESVIFRKGN